MCPTTVATKGEWYRVNACTCMCNNGLRKRSLRRPSALMGGKKGGTGLFCGMLMFCSHAYANLYMYIIPIHIHYMLNIMCLWESVCSTHLSRSLRPEIHSRVCANSASRGMYPKFWFGIAWSNAILSLSCFLTVLAPLARWWRSNLILRCLGAITRFRIIINLA